MWTIVHLLTCSAAALSPKKRGRLPAERPGGIRCFVVGAMHFNNHCTGLSKIVNGNCRAARPAPPPNKRMNPTLLFFELPNALRQRKSQTFHHSSARPARRVIRRAVMQKITDMPTQRDDEESRRDYWIKQMESAYGFMDKMLDYPVEECGEPLVSLPQLVRTEGLSVQFSHTKLAENHERLFYLRRGLIEDFTATSREMNDRGWTLRVEDGFRSRAVIAQA